MWSVDSARNARRSTPARAESASSAGCTAGAEGQGPQGCLGSPWPPLKGPEVGASSCLSARPFACALGLGFLPLTREHCGQCFLSCLLFLPCQSGCGLPPPAPWLPLRPGDQVHLGDHRAAVEMGVAWAIPAPALPLENKPLGEQAACPVPSAWPPMPGPGDAAVPL